MKQDIARALQHVHAGILGVGAAALAKEDFWLVLGTPTSRNIAAIEGGMSQYIGVILKLAFDPRGHNLERAGIEVVLNDGRRLRIFLKLDCVLCDESALHQIWMCKGASGTKPCVECRFIVNPHWIAADELEDTDDLVFVNRVFGVRKLQRHNKHTIHAIVDDLARNKPLLTKGAFEAKGPTSIS